MAEESAKSEVQGTSADQNPNSVEATIESSLSFGATESTCNNGGSSNVESPEVIDDGEREKSLEYAEELMTRGSKAAKESDYAEATDCYSRALEIRVAHFGELAPECVTAYYKYGCALLYKAQEEADPLGSMPKKEGASEEDSNKNGSVKNSGNGESSAISGSNITEQGGGTNCSDDTPDNNAEEKGEEGDDAYDAEELADGDEDESDLDLAWKMLDVARAIVEKHSGDTMEKVDILSALAEVALEREDVETSLSDYSKSLSILERLVESDSRLIAELNFRICLCLEIGSKPEEAIPYCQKAISVCKSRVQRLAAELKNSAPAENQTTPESVPTLQPSSSTSISGDPLADKEAEIETLTGLCGELEKKLEDLQHAVSNPRPLLPDLLGMMAAKAKATEKMSAPAAMSSSQVATAGTGGATETMSSSQVATAGTGGATETSTVSTAHTNGSSGVTHLGVVGRGVKRVVMSSSTDSAPAKKPSIDPSSKKDS